MLCAGPLGLAAFVGRMKVGVEHLVQWPHLLYRTMDANLVPNTTISLVHSLGSCFGVELDLNVTIWLLWLFTPVLVAFLLPWLIMIFIYLSSLFVYIYKLHRHRLRTAYEIDFFEGARQTLAALWDAQGWIWHGYEIHGLDHIPPDGGALIVYYHGAIPIDYYYVMAKSILYKGRHIRSVGDRFLFRMPGWSGLMEALQVIPGTVQSCASILRNGELLAISPGGVYEAYFSTEYYNLIWRKRIGFAKVALEAKVPILPMFTENLREAFRAPQWGSSFWKWLYLKTRLPLIPLYGNFPVKMRTFIGEPIEYDSSYTPEQLAQKTQLAIEALIREHQYIPGSILRALLARVYDWKASKKRS